jgi:hypothetical protein
MHYWEKEREEAKDKIKIMTKLLSLLLVACSSSIIAQLIFYTIIFHFASTNCFLAVLFGQFATSYHTYIGIFNSFLSLCLFLYKISSLKKREKNLWRWCMEFFINFISDLFEMKVHKILFPST